MNKYFRLSVNLGSAAREKDNNFRIIRHIAAALVVYSHAFIVNGGPENAANNPLYLAFGIPIGDVAVNVFFIVSGFLVTNSLVSRGDITDFFLSRFLRIYPAMIVVALISAFVLGPIVSDLSFAEYFSQRSVYGFAFWNSLMATPKLWRYELPGVFTTNPYPNVVNGSLWSLGWELWMYWLLIVLFIGGVMRKPLFWAVPIYLLYLLTQFGQLHLSEYPVIALRLLSFFYAGALISIYRDRVELSPFIFLAVAVLFVLSTVYFQNAFLAPICLAYATIFLAHYPTIVAKQLSHGSDISYGIYIYAYPIQQLLVWKFGPHNPYLHTVIALILTIPLAYFSWILVESPCIKLKQVIRSRDRSTAIKHGPQQN